MTVFDVFDVMDACVASDVFDVSDVSDVCHDISSNNAVVILRISRMVIPS